jgi:hypothetical protein
MVRRRRSYVPSMKSPTYAPRALALVVYFSARSASAAPPNDGDLRPPMPEPIFSETVTDLDGTEAGEIEFEANGSVFRARRGGAYALDASVEAEWLATRRLGFRIEPTVSRDVSTVDSGTAVGASGGVSWKLVRDPAHDFHVQAEVVARLPWDESAIVQPGDPALPLAFDLRAGYRVAGITFRASGGYGGFGDAEHVPVRASIAALTTFEPTGRFGFWGVELDGDGARTAPVVAAINIVPSVGPAGLPFRVGLALPWAVGERDDRPSLGIFVRIFYESSRERDFTEGRN